MFRTPGLKKDNSRFDTSSHQVPSAFFLTDVFIWFDGVIMNKKVFKPDYKKKESRMSLASNEAVVMKRLISALRALWRSSQNRGLDNHITDLKSYLRASPSPEAGSPVAPAVADRSSSDEEDDLESDHGSGEAIVAHSESDTSDGDVSQSVDTLDAPTLQLGEQSPTTEKDGSGSDSDSLSGETVASRTPSDQRDSQVSSGWLGKCYMAENARARAEAAKERRNNQLDTWIRGVKSELESDLNTELDGELWDGYYTFARKAFKDYGESVYGRLANAHFYRGWVRGQKSKDCLFGKGKFFFLITTPKSIWDLGQNCPQVELELWYAQAFVPCLPLVSLSPSFSQDAGEDDSQMDVAAEVPTSREDTHTHTHMM